MPKNYKNENGLNKATEFGITSDAELLFEQKFVWKKSEFAMLILVGGIGLFLAFAAQPQVLGIGFFGGALYLATVNASKKKKSLIQLYQTPDGLKLYHNGLLSESANNDSFKLDDVSEVVLVQTQTVPKLLLKSDTDENGENSNIKIPLRMVRSADFRKFLKENQASGKIKVAKQVLDEMSEWEK